MPHIHILQWFSKKAKKKICQLVSKFCVSALLKLYPRNLLCITDEIVALKRLKMEKEKEGFPITSLREINTLLKAQHTNIVTVRVSTGITMLICWNWAHKTHFKNCYILSTEWSSNVFSHLLTNTTLSTNTSWILMPLCDWNVKVILCASEHICSIVRYCFRSFKQL